MNRKQAMIRETFLGICCALFALGEPAVPFEMKQNSLLSSILAGTPREKILAAYPPVDFDSAAFRQRVQEAENAASQPGAFVFEGGQAVLKAGTTRYSAGHFSVPSIGELKAQLKSGPGKIRLSVMLGASELSDIQYLQAHADGDTLFQLASQFNGLEAPSARLVPVAAYFGDRTQGPLGALPAFPGALLRHYAAPDGQGGRFTQSGKHQLNFLADVIPSSIGRVQDGYLVSQNVADPAALAKKLSDDFASIRIGVHRELEIVGTGARVDQVLTSTLAGGGYSAADTRQEPWLTIQRQLLRAAYLGTLLAAIEAGRGKVLLTAIGGGVFANPHPLIWESILWAIEQARPHVRADLHVILNLRSFGVDSQILEAAVKANGGVLIRHGKP